MRCNSWYCSLLHYGLYCLQNTQWMGSTDYSGGFSEGFFGSILPDTGPRIMDDIVLQYGQTMTFENGELIFRNARDALDSVIGM